MNDLPEKPSKSALKREMTDLQALGAELVELSKDQLKKVDLPDDLREAVRDAQRFTQHEAHRRQLQYIGKLMRSVDAAPIQAKLDEWNGSHAEEIARMHRLENWRQRLIDDDAALAELLTLHSEFDVQQLRTLIRNSRKEQLLGKPPKSSRELFRVLREAFSLAS